MSENVAKLRLLCGVLGIRPKSVAKAAGVSPAYISRLLSETDPLQGSPTFWRRLEESLPALVAGRSLNVFAVPVTQPASDPVEQLAQEPARMVV